MSTVGVIVNPIAGKDIRRLVTAASHTSDSAKIDTVRRTVIAAVECGAERVVIAPDPNHLAHRAVAGLGLAEIVDLVDIAVRGSREDTVAAATRMWKEEVGALVVLGGDGTCRDVALGWPDAPLIAISTGTNNVYPSALDATSAGSAAGLVATGAIDPRTVTRRSKRISAQIIVGDTVIDDLALIDLALIDTTFVGSRAVLDPAAVRVVVASVANPMSTGLSSIAGRLHPIDRWTPGGVLIRLGPGGRRVRAPLAPGSFTTVDVADVVALRDGEPITLHGPGVLAFDGERDRRIGADVVVSVKVDMAGPLLIDVHATLLAAASRQLFDGDRPRGHALHDLIPEEHDGD